MKYFIPLALLAFFITSCAKKKSYDPKNNKELCICSEEYDKGDGYNYDKDEEYAEKDENRETENFDALTLEKYIVDPLTIDESCGCATKGKIKYVFEGEKVLFLAFGDGTCDEWAEQYWMVDKENYKGCKFKMDCSLKINESNTISEDELKIIKSL